MSKVTIETDGKVWANWKDCSIVKSVDMLAGAFAVKLGDTTQDGSSTNFKMGNEVKISINDEPIITGYIDYIEFESGSEETMVLIRGRDVGDLVDCCYYESVNEWKNQTIKAIITELCNPFNITVKSITALSDRKITTFKAQEGEAIYTMIYRLCNEFAIQAITDGKRNLVLSDISSEKMSDILQAPGNVVKTSMIADDTDRFSEYVTKGQGLGTPEKSLESYLQCSGSDSDSGIARYRPNVILSDNPLTNEQSVKKSQRESHYTAGLSRQVIFTVQSFEQSNGKIWKADSLVDIDNKILSIDDEMYIHEIEYQRTGDDEKTIINCVWPGTYDLNKKIKKTDFDI